MARLCFSTLAVAWVDALIWALAACAPVNAQQFSLKRDGNVVHFSGALSADSASQLVKEIGSHVTSDLVITSPGGDAQSAIVVANIVFDRKIKIIVRDFCNSACAQYIALSSPKIVVEPNSILIFHHSMFVMNVLLKSLNEPATDKIYAEAVRSEKRLYSRININSMIYATSIEALKPLCLKIDASKTSSNPERYGVMSREVGFQPGVKLLKAFGYRGAVSGFPSNQVQLDSAVKNLPFRQEFRPVFIDAGNKTSHISRKIVECL